MATTKLWHISGNLRDVIDYAENPEKTCPIPDLEDLANAARYVQRPEATADGQFVTGINCLAETAVQQMQLTKEQYHKTGGYILRTRKNEITAAILPLRERLKLCSGIESRSLHMQETMDLVYDNELRHRDQRERSHVKHEYGLER